MDTNPVIERAIKAAGTQANLAKLSGVSQQHISKLLLRKTPQPSLDVAIKIARATNGEVALGDILPEVVSALGEEKSRLGLLNDEGIGAAS